MYRRFTSELVAFLLAVGCSTTPAKQPEGGGSAAVASPIDLSRGARARPEQAWPPGLVPCPKDAPAGEGCATPSAARGSGASPAPARHGPVAHPGEADATIWKVPVGADDPVRGPV